MCRILPTSLLLLSAFSTFSVASAQDGLQIAPPDPPPQQCGSFTFQWSGGVPPYTFLIKTDSDPNPIRDPFPNGTENTTFTWDPVDVSGGTHLFLELEDSNQQVGYSKGFKIQSSDDNSCLFTSSSASSTMLSSTSSTSDNATASATLSTPTQFPSSLSIPTSSSPSSSLSQTSSQRLSTGAIAGIAVGLAILSLLAVGAFFYLRRRRRAGRGSAAGLFGGAKYRSARNSVGPLSKGTEQPVTFWDANMFVREKAATTQVRDSLLSSLVSPSDLGLGLPTIASRDVPSLHSKGDDELVSLVDPGSDSDDSNASGVTSHRTSPLPVSSFLDTPYPPDLPANAIPGCVPDDAEQATVTGGGADGRPHDSRP